MLTRIHKLDPKSKLGYSSLMSSTLCIRSCNAEKVCFVEASGVQCIYSFCTFCGVHFVEFTWPYNTMQESAFGLLLIFGLFLCYHWAINECITLDIHKSRITNHMHVNYHRSICLNIQILPKMNKCLYIFVFIIKYREFYN